MYLIQKSKVIRESRPITIQNDNTCDKITNIYLLLNNKYIDRAIYISLYASSCTVWNVLEVTWVILRIFTQILNNLY